MITLAQLDQALRRKELAPVYLLVGPEIYLHRSAIDHIAKTAQRMTEGGCDPIRHSAESATANDILADANSAGLFHARQLLIVSHVEHWRASDLEAVAQYVTTPNPATTLVLSADKLDGRTKAAKIITEHAVTVTCKPLYANQIPDWIRMECERLGKPIAREAAQFLAEAVGTELSQLAEAIEKIMLYAGEARLIEPHLVEHVIVETSSQDIFAFTRAVGEKNVQVATERLGGLLAANEPAVRILTMLARHWRLLYQTRWLREHQSGNERELATTLKVHPFFVREYVEQSKRHSLAALQKGFTQLVHADRLLKRSSRPDTDIMTHCLVHLCMLQ